MTFPPDDRSEATGQPEARPAARPADAEQERPEAAGDWNPDGTELARALISRARVAGRTGGQVNRAARRTRSATDRRRSAGSTGSGWSGAGVDDRDPQPLDRSVERLVSEHGWGSDLAVHSVLARWDGLVGPEVAAHVRPERYADDELTVRADSTAWATQVRLLAANLVRRINEEIGEGSVTRVVVLGPAAPDWTKGPRRVRGRGPRDTYG